MKRHHSVADLKAAAPSVISKIKDAKSGLSATQAAALDEMVQLALDHAQEISKDEAAVIEAGVGGKPKSVH